MPLKFQRTVLVVALLVSACAGPHDENRSLFDGYPAVVSEPRAQDADFGFRYASKGCPYEIIDAFRHTYRTNGMDVPIPMKLTDNERAIIFRAVIDSGFFDLPPSMNAPEAAERGADTHELSVWNVSYHKVLWRNVSRSGSPDDERVMKLLRTIHDVVHARGDVARVQPKGCGCGHPETP